jgi:hypothetical protein
VRPLSGSFGATVGLYIRKLCGTMMYRLVMLLAVVLAACQPAAQTPAPTVTFTPRFEEQEAYNTGQCIRVTRPTYLRLGPGVRYPILTNIPVRLQPPIHIIESGVVGNTCADPNQCSLRDEGWWWPVEIHWLDTGDVDQGWVRQADLKACP